MYYFLNTASVILGVLVILVCLIDDIPEPYRKLTIYTMPIILIVNYFSLIEIQKYRG